MTHDPAVIAHYVLDSASPEWIREMLAMESEPELPAIPAAKPIELEAA